MGGMKPLRLAFRAREGWVVGSGWYETPSSRVPSEGGVCGGKPLRLAFRARERWVVGSGWYETPSSRVPSEGGVCGG